MYRWWFIFKATAQANLAWYSIKALKIKIGYFTTQGKLADVLESGFKSVISYPSSLISHLLSFLLGVPAFITDTTITEALAFTFKSWAVSVTVMASLWNGKKKTQNSICNSTSIMNVPQDSHHTIYLCQVWVQIFSCYRLASHPRALIVG